MASYGTRTEYTVKYGGMRGVDFSSASQSGTRCRFAYLENMYRDYAGGADGVTESVPGFRKLTSVYRKIHSIYTHTGNDGKEYAVVHAKDSLYRFAVEERDALSRLKAIATVRNAKSRAFTVGGCLYVLDGENITRIDGDGAVSRADDGAAAQPYIPTVYYGGKEYEQRNLLTDSFREVYPICSSADLAAASEGLRYRVVSEEDGTAAVSGIEDGAAGAVFIPAHTDISGKSYTVTEISQEAFYGNTGITALRLSDTVVRIGRAALLGCTGLESVICGRGLEVIEGNAFLACEALTKVYIHSGIRSIGTAAFNSCTALKSIDFGGESAELAAADVQAALTGITVNYGVKYGGVTVEIPIYSPAASLTSVTLDGAEVSYTYKKKDGFITAVILSGDEGSLDGAELVAEGIANPTHFTKNSTGHDFLAENGGDVTGREAILGCTVCECFDGRVFLSGNPKLPNTVFYSARNGTGSCDPLYFGTLNYFNDGTGSFPVTSLLAAGDALAVFKAGDDGGGSIYYHTPSDTGIDILPKIYPTSYVHGGIAAVGESVSFFDDPIFLSALGCCALDKKRIDLERSVAVRSHNVNAKLLGEELAEISMAKWCGYLVLQAGERIYLADSRATFTHATGFTEYEWYYLTGIGAYRGAARVFKYAAVAKSGFTAHPTRTDCEVTGEVYLTMNALSESVYYTEEDGVKYEVYTDGEMRGGSFSPASCVCSAGGELLFFGTEGGDICVFNNDKRGTAPDYIAEKADFDAAEYAAAFGRRIHPCFYSFDGHAPRCALRTVSDDGGIPHLAKNTVKGSLAVKVRCMGASKIICEAGTEGEGYGEVARLPDSAPDFAELDFSALAFSSAEFVTLAVNEREKRWTEKSLGFYSESYASPFGIYSAAYRFTIKGKIKN